MQENIGRPPGREEGNEKGHSQTNTALQARGAIGGTGAAGSRTERKDKGISRRFGAPISGPKTPFPKVSVGIPSVGMCDEEGTGRKGTGTLTTELRGDKRKCRTAGGLMSCLKKKSLKRPGLRGTHQVRMGRECKNGEQPS